MTPLYLLGSREILMKLFAGILLLSVVMPNVVSAQKTVKTSGDKAKAEKVQVPKDDKSALDLAKAAVTAHGGEKFLKMKTLIVSGSVDVTTTAFSQAIPATFVTIFSGDKYRIEINNPFTPFKQVYDGEQTSSTLKGSFTLPPLNRLGFPLLAKVGEKDFTVTALTGDAKKKKGFRVIAPEGFYTDFYLDGKTNQITGYEAAYDINGRNVTTTVEIDKFRTVDGIILPEKYAQRFDTEQMTIYADFKAKDITVNKEVGDDIFTLKSK